MRLMMVIALLIPAGLGAQTFVDKGVELGLYYSYGDCFLAGGIAFTDFDLDGVEDILAPSCQGQPVRIFKGDDEGFSLFPIDALQTDTAESKAIYAVDLDNDGDREIFIANFQAANTLLWNEDGEYVDVSESAGLSTIPHSSFGATFGDYDLDGFLDIYVVNRATLIQSEQNQLYRNNGDGTFQNTTFTAGVPDVDGAGLAACFIEVDNDGWPDLYIANDKLTGNRLFRNQGDGTFADISEDSGAYLEMDGMSVSLTDYNEDGYSDIYITNTPSGGNKFLVSNGDMTYDEMSDDLGITVGKMCWGSVFLDFDLDMDEDLFVPSLQPVFDNQNDFFLRHEQFFIDWADETISDDMVGSMGAAIADYDYDGDYDLAVLNGGIEFMYLLENQHDAGNWIKFCLEGTTSNWEGVGSWVEVHAGGEIQRKYLTCGSNFSGQDSRHLIFGLDDAEVVDLIRITWPSGIIQEIEDHPVNVTTCFEEAIVTDVSQAEPGFKVWPVPAQDELKISMLQEGTLTLFDSRGVLVATHQLATGSHSLDITYLRSGIYTIRGPQGVFTRIVLM